MRPLSAITPALLVLTVATSGACHHSARDAGVPLPAHTVGPAELARERGRRVEELLAGRFAGVRVLPTPNGGFTIRIRGVTTLSGHAEPLYIIDGMPVTLVPGEGLNWLDPAEILQIDVLKDPAETSMYGVRGANGVIVIRTKRGSG